MTKKIASPADRPAETAKLYVRASLADRRAETAKLYVRAQKLTAALPDIPDDDDLTLLELTAVRKRQSKLSATYREDLEVEQGNMQKIAAEINTLLDGLQDASLGEIDDAAKRWAALAEKKQSCWKEIDTLSRDCSALRHQQPRHRIGGAYISADKLNDLAEIRAAMLGYGDPGPHGKGQRSSWGVQRV